MFDFLCVLGTKFFFEKGTIVLQSLLQDGGAMISLILLGRRLDARRTPASYSAPMKVNINF